VNELAQKLFDVRSRICDACVLAFAIFAMPALAASLYRAVDFGWQPINALHILIGISALAMVFSRKRIPYKVRATYLVAMFVFMGVSSIWTFGLLAAGLLALAIAPVLSTILFGIRSGVMTLVFVVLAVGLIGTATVLNNRLPAFDVVTYMTSAPAWMLAIIGIVFTSGTTIFALEALNKFFVVSAETSHHNAAAMADSETKYRDILNNMPDILFRTDIEGRLLMISPSAEDILGYTPEELIDRDNADLYGNAKSRTRLLDEIAKADGKLIGLTIPMRHKDGHVVVTSTNASYYRDAQGNILGVEGISRDTTDQRKAETALKEHEEALRRAQRMETVGQLTGGIAHDFNNLLGIMVGNTEMLKDKIAGDKDGQEYLDDLKWAVDRAASLTSRLLAFSRKQTLSPVAVNFNDLIDSLDDLLRRTLGETIILKIHPTPGLWLVTIDPHQFENTLVNLALNARDAMPKGGTLTIEAANVTLDETYAQQYDDVVSGDYVKIAVSDTGTGMPPEVQKKVFEPFFTTKDVGKGSGLGLSMVYGLILQSKGHITIYSEEDLGTTVSLYIPRSGEASAKETTSNGSQEIEMGSERILIVEDDARVRKIPARILKDQGYDVEEAENGREALEHLRGDRPIDLLFTDMVLPGGMNGAQIAEEAVRLQPNIKVIYATGYAEHSDILNGLAAFTVLVNKPYSREDLLVKVRAVLDNDTPTNPPDS